ncbi:MAG: M28 family metallopeptidase [Promethearchaeota archaeon]
MLDNTKEILQILEALSFPRLASSIHEDVAFDTIKKKISEQKINFSSQQFTFTTFYSIILPKILFTLFFLLLFSIFFDNLILSLIIIVFITIFSIFIINPIKFRIGKKVRSQNLYVKYPKKGIENKVIEEFSNIKGDHSKNILCIAHVDSKGQRFSIKIRILSFKLWSYSFFIGLIIILIHNLLFFNLYIYIVEIILIGINLIALFSIILNTTNNKSPGALDNASGVACVLELLKYYSNRENRLNNYNLWFLLTGAEELGTMGIRHFYNNIMNFNKKKSYIINFDSIGKNVSYYSSSINNKKNKELYHKFLQIANNIKLKLKFSSSTFGVRSDGLYLKNQNFLGFGFGDPTSFEHIHSINDTVDKVDVSLLEKLCKFIINVLKELDDNY